MSLCYILQFFCRFLSSSYFRNFTVFNAVCRKQIMKGNLHINRKFFINTQNKTFLKKRLCCITGSRVNVCTDRNLLSGLDPIRRKTILTRTASFPKLKALPVTELTRSFFLQSAKRF